MPIRTLTVIDAVLPALSATVRVTGVMPGVDTTTSAGHAPLAKPERSSAQVKCTVTEPLRHVVSFGVAEMVGATLSMFRPLTVVDRVLPALSVPEPVADRLVPSPFTVTGALHVPKPESPSVHVKFTVTGALYQPLALGARSGAPETVGPVRSMLMPLAPPDAVLPARSETVALTDWLAPSVLSVTLAGQAPEARPEPPSAHVKCTATAPLYQPLALAAVVGAPVIVGAVLSMLIPDTV